MKVVEMKEAKSSLADYASELSEESVIITKNGKPVAALINIENADFETVSLSRNPEFLAIIEHSRKRQKSEGGVSSDEMRRRLGLSK